MTKVSNMLKVAKSINGARFRNMQPIADAISKELEGSAIAYLVVRAQNQFLDSVWVNGSFDPKEEWRNGYIKNSDYFRFSIYSAGENKEVYAEGDKVTVKLHCRSLGQQKFRQSTCTPEKAIAKIRAWIENELESDRFRYTATPPRG